MVRLGDKVTIEHYTQSIEWYHVWWPWLASKRVAQVCQHQMSFLLTNLVNKKLSYRWETARRV